MRRIILMYFDLSYIIISLNSLISKNKFISIFSIIDLEFNKLIKFAIIKFLIEFIFAIRE